MSSEAPIPETRYAESDGLSIAYQATTATAQRWPADAPDARVATSADLPAITGLHDGAFPGTYATARQLLAGIQSQL